MIGGRHHRVQQQLAVLAAGITLPQARVERQDVIALNAGVARERLIVEADDRDHAVRHEPHRHQGRDGDLTGAEVRTRWAGAELVGEQRPHVCQRQDRLVGMAGGLP